VQRSANEKMTANSRRHESAAAASWQRGNRGGSQQRRMARINIAESQLGNESNSIGSWHRSA